MTSRLRRAGKIKRKMEVDNDNVHSDTHGKSWVVSLDPGYKNFAFVIEEFDEGEIQSLPKIPKQLRYNADGTVTEKFRKILEKVYDNGKVILFENSDLTHGCVDRKKGKSKALDVNVFHNLTELLDQYHDYWSQCDAFVIEMQMAFRGVYNIAALKIAQHCFSYFTMRYGRRIDICEYPAYFKTQILGAPKTIHKTRGGKVSYKAMTKPERKKWCTEKACEILTRREDFDTLSVLNSKSKRDDISDCIGMCVSWRVLRYIDKSI